MSTRTPEWCDLVRLHEIIKYITVGTMKLPSMQKLSSIKRGQFAVDLALIGLSLRTAYLVDILSPQDPVQVFGGLIYGLRLVCPEFKAVTHVHEPGSDQSFFVNVALLTYHGTDGPLASSKISFVQLGTDVSFTLLPNPPSALTLALISLIEDATSQDILPPSINIRQGLPRTSAIPLAAILLEYPVAYVPECLDRPFLNNVPLDVFECTLTFSDNGPHTLLKFSSPSELGRHHPQILGSSHIIESLVRKFSGRIQSTKLDASLEVSLSLQTLDRVML